MYGGFGSVDPSRSGAGQQVSTLPYGRLISISEYVAPSQALAVSPAPWQTIQVFIYRREHDQRKPTPNKFEMVKC
jgi:hypothetical protein